MTEWFCSGKIYTKNENGGHKQTGYFATTANSEDDTPAGEVMSEMIRAAANTYGAKEIEIHVEQLYKV